MRLSQVFDDLGGFVRHHRGRISRDGLLLFTNTPYDLGTVLDIEMRLADGLTLVVGQAGVVQVLPGSPSTDHAWSVVLKWVELDDDSAALLDRIETREAADGVAPFRLTSILPPPSGPLRRPLGQAAASATETTDDDDDSELATPDPSLAVESTETLGELVTSALGRRPSVTTTQRSDGHSSSGRRHRRRRRSRQVGHVVRWIIGLGAVAVIIAAVALLWLPQNVERTGTPFVTTGVAPTRVPTVAVSPPPSPAATATVAATPVATPPPATAVPTTVPPTATVIPIRLPTAPPAPRDANPTSGEAPSPRAIAIELAGDSAATVVTITTDSPIRSDRVRLDRLDSAPGPREIVRIIGLASSAIEPRREIMGPHLTAIRTWLHDELDPPELHVVLDLADTAVHADPPAIDGPTVTIRLTR